MPRKPRHTLTPSQVRDLLASYEKKETKVREIAESYGITEAYLYRILHDNDVTPHRFANVNGTMVMDEPEIEEPLPEVEEVQPTQKIWEVKYTGTMFVQAKNIDLALAKARHQEGVRRVYSIKEKI